jgi:uncharacterized membrane protein YqhA
VGESAPSREDTQETSVAKQAAEQVLWGSRLIVLPAVIFSIALAAGIVYITSVDAVRVLGTMIQYASTPERDATRIALLADIVKLIDGYLLAGVVIIFGLGLYELFIGKIGYIEGSEVASRLLLIRSLDDLKDRLAKVVVLVLVIEFFEQALGLHFATAQDLLYLAIGIALLGVALYLVGRLGH